VAVPGRRRALDAVSGRRARDIDTPKVGRTLGEGAAIEAEKLDKASGPGLVRGAAIFSPR
jgi:hypothetical protein